MKRPFLVVILVIGICFVKAGKHYVLGDDASNSNGNFSNSLLDMIKEVIKQGYPDAGIPVLDPYRFDCTHVDFEDNIFRILANITDGTFSGLSDFKMKEFNFSIEDRTYIVYFDVYFPLLKFISNYYEMKGSITEAIPLAGEGIAHVEVYDFNIWSKLYLEVTEDSIMVDKLEDTGFSVSRIVSKTEYDNNIDDIANALIEDLLAGYLNRFHKYLAFTISPFVIDALNTALSENLG